MKKRDPSTREEWQEAVDGAHGALLLDNVRQYGLVTGGPTINVARCEEILKRGRAIGITPAPDAAERFVASVQADARSRLRREQ